MKKCSKCKVDKPESKFGKDSTRKDGLHPYCLNCRRLEYKERKGYIRNRQRMLEFGVGTNWYNEKFDLQNGRCAICGNIETSKNQYGLKSLAIDHDHNSGQVRGLLCNNCNNGLGRFKDNIGTLKQAIQYLEYYIKITQKGA